MYFSKFPLISYPFEFNGEIRNILITDITKNIRFLTKSLRSIQLYDTYIIQDGETPEIISEKFYSSPNYHWIIMLANEKYNYIEDFPKTQQQLEEYINEKYGDSADEPSIFVKFGKVVDYGTVNSYKITNRNYEYMINEKKRAIKIISKDLLNVILNDFSRLMNG